MSAFASAIDDSFDPIPQPSPNEEYTDDSFFDNAYQGPRDGHWEVTSSVGSFIDDSGPTIYGYRHKSHDAGRGAQIDEGLAKRLMQATIEGKRNAAQRTKQDTPATGGVSDRSKPSFAPSRVKAPKPFIVPALRNKPYDPVAPDVPDASNNSTSPPSRDSRAPQRKPSSTIKLSAPATRPTPSPAATTTKATSNRPDSSPSSGRTIKILGKNGEVAYVNLPSLPKSYSKAPSSIKYAASAHPVERDAPVIQQEKQAASPSPNFGGSIGKSATPAFSERLVEEPVHNQDDQWITALPASETKRSHRSTPAMMSGALPSPSPWASPLAQSAAASCKDSGIVMGGMSAVASKAGSHKTASTKRGSAISQGVLSVAQKIANMSPTPIRQPNSVPAAPSPQPFEEIGMGVTTGFPARKGSSGHSNRKAIHTGFGSERGSQRSVGSKKPSVRSTHERSEQRTMLSNYKPPTVRSGSNSSSISHGFSGFQQAGSVQQADAQDALHNDRQGSVHSRQAQLASRKHSKATSSSSRTRPTPSVTRLAIPEIKFGAKNAQSPMSDPRSPSNSPVSTLATSPHMSLTGKQKTNFAGDGWISPHPLSVASTNIGAAPQSEVYINADGFGHCGTLTYSEWRTQRDAARSIAGSFAGSRVPSAVEIHTVPTAVYNYPPPASYVGSYDEQTRRPPHPRTQLHHNLGRGDLHETRASGAHADHPATVQHQRSTGSSRRSVNSRHSSLGRAGNNSVHKGSPHRAPSVLAQDGGWTLPPSLPPLHDSSTSASEHPPGSGYNVGLTPTELANYQRRLSGTISHYSSRLSHVQQEQTHPRSDYHVRSSGQSHASGRASSRHSATSRHSAHAFPPNLSYPREKVRVEMPWDHESSRSSSPSSSSSSSTISHHTHSQHAYSAHRGSPIATHAQRPGSTILQPRRSDGGSRVSAASHSTVHVPRSQATYGTEEWQDLENAEDGNGRFQPRQDWRMW